MLEKKPSQDFHFEFQHRWGGVPSAVQQFEDWSKKQKGIFRFILLNFCLPWYAKWWLEFKVDKTMHDVDQQIENLNLLMIFKCEIQIQSHAFWKYFKL